jgi:SET domain-containing protein
LEVRASRIYGRGCFTLVPLKRRRKIAAYAGELLRGRRRIWARIREQEARGDIKVIQLNEDVAIDGAVGGDATAYINHSCAPNAYMRTVPGDKLVFFALRDIAPGEEITINYRDPLHPETCRCQAPNCRSNRRRTQAG